jgi:hypothetical protein
VIRSCPSWQASLAIYILWFTLILSELTKFNQMKDEIRTKTKTKIDDETKKSLIKKGKEQAVEQFKNMFGKTH